MHLVEFSSLALPSVSRHILARKEVSDIWAEWRVSEMAKIKGLLLRRASAMRLVDLIGEQKSI